MNNIAKLRKLRGLTQKQVAIELNVSGPTVSDWEKGKKNPNHENLLKLSQLLSASTDYILGLADENSVDDSLLDVVNETNNSLLELYGNPYQAKKVQDEIIAETMKSIGIVPIRTRKVPILGGIAAGEPIYAQEEHEEYADVDEDTPCDYALRVEGDSMEPTICLGDLVFIRRQSDVNDGQIAAVLIEDSATLKRIFHQSGSLTLISDNAAKYPPRHITCEDGEIRIMGRAVSFKRFLK